MSDARDSASALPPLCYIRHPETDETVIIIRREPGWRPAHTKCSPECLNAKLAHPPTPEQILAMKHGSLVGWDTPGADPAVWQRAAAGGARGTTTCIPASPPRTADERPLGKGH